MMLCMFNFNAFSQCCEPMCCDMTRSVTVYVSKWCCDAGCDDDSEADCGFVFHDYAERVDSEACTDIDNDCWGNFNSPAIDFDLIIPDPANNTTAADMVNNPDSYVLECKITTSGLCPERDRTETYTGTGGAWRIDGIPMIGNNMGGSVTLEFTFFEACKPCTVNGNPITASRALFRVTRQVTGQDDKDFERLRFGWFGSNSSEGSGCN